MNWLKRLLYLLVVLAVIAVALPFVLPLNFYAPKIERFVADRIHEPVTILGLHVVLLPEPALVLEDVSAGKSQEFKAQIVRVTVDPFSLMRPVKVLNQISFDTVTASQEVLGRLPSWLKADSAAPQVQIKEIRLNRLKMNVAPVDPGVVSADIALTPEGGFAHALISSEDGRASLAITPEQDSYALELNARNWQPPTGPSVVFDELHINASLAGDELNMKEIGGSLYGGTITGAAKLDWHDGWRLNGEAHGKRVEVQSVASLLSPETAVSGRMDADGRFSMKAKSYAQLFAAPSVDVKFKVADGVIHNLDMVKAVRAGDGSRGGQTRFDELSGALQVSGKSYRLRQLRISSGLLSAEGGLEIASGNQVSGSFHVQIKGSANFISVPMTLGGTLADPVLKASGSVSVEPAPEGAPAQE